MRGEGRKADSVQGGIALHGRARFFGVPQNDSISASRRESLADPLKPYDPASLCNPPIFPVCFTHRRRVSDAFMHS